MILLDTNVISEMMKAKPDLQVVKWLDQQNPETLFISTITIAEIAYGLNTLPEGIRRTSLQYSFDSTIKLSFQHRILTFDVLSAHIYGKFMAYRKVIGHPFNILDAQIASIAYTHKCTLATRNTRDFMPCDFPLIDPFLE